MSDASITTADNPGLDAREVAWRIYEARLGNLTTSEENRIRGAWHSGWTAAENRARKAKQ